MTRGALDDARESLRLARLRTLMFALLLVGLPLAVSISLIAGRSALPATAGPQPGGLIRGSVQLADDGPASDVPVELVVIALDGSTPARVETRTDEDGRFALEAPPVEGKYAIVAGGGELRRTVREFSFLDSKSQPIDPGELELSVVPGVALTIELVRVSARYVNSGRYELRARVHDGPFGILPSELTDGDEFDDGRIELDGLPPFEGTLLLFLSNGDEVTLNLKLAPGTHHRSVEL